MAAFTLKQKRRDCFWSRCFAVFSGVYLGYSMSFFSCILALISFMYFWMPISDFLSFWPCYTYSSHRLQYIYVIELWTDYNGEKLSLIVQNFEFEFFLQTVCLTCCKQKIEIECKITQREYQQKIICWSSLHF